MTQPAEDVPPVLDASILKNLLLELDNDEGLWKIFVRNYVHLLPARIEKVRMNLTTGDLPGTTDGVLSLKTSSQMVGAVRLANLAELLQRDLPLDSGIADPALVLPRLAAAHYQSIKACSLHTAYLLQKHLEPAPGHSNDADPSQSP